MTLALVALEVGPAGILQNGISEREGLFAMTFSIDKKDKFS